MDRQRIAVSTPAEWAAVCSDSFVPLRVRSVEPAFRANLSHVQLDSRVGVTRVASKSSEVYRSARVIAKDPRDDLLLSVHRTGVGTVVQDDRVAFLKRGTASLYDSSRPYLLSFPDTMSEVVLQFPRTALGLSEKRLSSLTARTLEPSVSLRALGSLLAAATGPEGVGTQPTESRAMADAAISLLRAALTPTGAGLPVLQNHLALRLAMEEFIENHLADSQLRAETLAHQHHVSLRLAQQLFAEVGGIASHIRLRRLEHARTLIDGCASVSYAAVLSGFGDPGTFTRAFKRAFGMTPREYALTRRVADGCATSPRPLSSGRENV